MTSQNFGFLLIDKPVSWTSFDVCAKLRKKLKTKKIGHTGTLDPFATGLLVVAVGKATKLIPFFEKDQKTYETEILLGHISETLDTESKISKLKNSNVDLEIQDIEQIISQKFLGRIQQIPPKYSALKIGGKKMCDMARKGESFEIKPRNAKVIKMEVLSLDFPVVKIRLVVAAGFYVRSFARDLGKALGLGGGICQQLRRIGVGVLKITNDELRMTNENGNLKIISELENNSLSPGTLSCTLHNSSLSSPFIWGSSQLKFPITQDITTVTPDDLISPEKILKLPQVEIEEGRIADFLQGRAFPFESNIKDKFIVLSGKRFLGLGEMKYGNLQPRMGFN